MASPVNDTYTITSGTTIYAGTFGEAVLGGVACTQSAVSSSAAIGSGIPSWVPAVGTVADVSTNTISAVAADSWAGGVFSWTGMAYAKDYGLYGSLIMTGGGHGDGVDNDIYRYDIATRVFSKIKNRATAYAAADNYIADTVTGWMWANTAASAMQVGEPFAAHFYAHLVGVPAAARSGATNGWLFTPGRNVMPLAGSRGTAQTHKIALGTETQWTLHGSPLTYGSGYGPGFYDSSRNRVVTFPGGTSINKGAWVNVADETTGVITLSAALDAYYAVGDYYAAKDVYVLARYLWNTGAWLKVIDPATGTIYTPPINTSNGPTETDEGAWCWAESWNAWVYYPALGGNNFYTLKAPADPKTGTWVWAKQTITGTIRSRPPTTHGPPYDRIRYVPSVDCVLWVAKYDEPVQAIRLTQP